MPTAKKLPSGSWRCLAYSHTEKVLDTKTGKIKDKRIYESFTSDDPSPSGRKEAEFAATQFQLERSGGAIRKRKQIANLTLAKAIDEYIVSREVLGRSPTTIQDYKCIRKNAFPDLMELYLKDIDTDMLQEAVSIEAKRPSNGRAKAKKSISAKRLKNEWGLISAVLHKYRKDIDFDEIELPQVVPRIVELPSAETVLRIIKGTDIELAVLLATWLSFSMSEVRGLTKSKSISGNHITIREVVVTVSGKPHRKDIGKNPTRNRRHRIPPYIMELIDLAEGDDLVPMTGNTLYHRWVKLQINNGLTPITFHDLRHLSASVMALLRVPDKYAQERGGWKSDHIMKSIYMQTLSEGRKQADDAVDNYFDTILNPDKKELADMTGEELIKLFKKVNPDGWKESLIDFMQHGMQHDTEKPT